MSAGDFTPVSVASSGKRAEELLKSAGSVSAFREATPSTISCGENTPVAVPVPLKSIIPLRLSAAGLVCSSAISKPPFPQLSLLFIGCSVLEKPFIKFPGAPINAAPTAPARAAFKSSSFQENGLNQFVSRSPFTLSSKAFCAPSWYPSVIALAGDNRPARAAPLAMRFRKLSSLVDRMRRPPIPFAPFMIYNSPGIVSVSSAMFRGIIALAFSLASSSLIPLCLRSYTIEPYSAIVSPAVESGLRITSPMRACPALLAVSLLNPMRDNADVAALVPSPTAASGANNDSPIIGRLEPIPLPISFAKPLGLKI